MQSIGVVIPLAGWAWTLYEYEPGQGWLSRGALPAAHPSMQDALALALPTLRAAEPSCGYWPQGHDCACYRQGKDRNYSSYGRKSGFGLIPTTSREF